MKLTKRDVDLATYDRVDNGRCILWDSLLPGFGLRVYPSGRKAFVLSYRAAGRKRLLTIGPHTVLTLDQARDDARQKLAAVIGGADPLAEKQRAAHGATIKMLCADYLARYAKPFKKSWEADERRLNRHIIPVWGTRQVIAITRADVAALHRDIAIKKKAPYEANRVLAVLGKMFECAIIWSYLPNNAANPARKIKKYRERKRDRWVMPQEMPQLAAAIDLEDNSYIRAAIWLYLLTGLRRNELLEATWEDVNLKQRELRVPDTKNDEPLHLPLSAPAIEILRNLPRVEKNPHVLPGRRPGEHLVELHPAWERVRDRATVNLWAQHEDRKTSGLVAKLTQELQREPTRAEVEKAADFKLPVGMQVVRLHDLRRTVGSWLAQAGNSLHLIGRVLNHKNTATTAIYARFAQDTVRQALEDHAKRILDVANQKKAKIVKLRSAHG